jgi:hypothetical protein
MVLVLKSAGIAWFPVPKNANTSIRYALSAMAEDERDLIRTWNNPMSLRMRRLARGCHKIAVVRDPVQRILSAYGERVIGRGVVGRTATGRIAARLGGLPHRPCPETFFDRFSRYRLLNDKVRRHTDLQCRYLGPDLGWFDAVYTLDGLDRLAEDLTRRLGRPVRFGRCKSDGPKFRPGDLSPRHRAMLAAYTAPDREMLARAGLSPRR